MTDLDYYLSLLPEEYPDGNAVMIRLKRYSDKIEINAYNGNRIDKWILLDMRSQYRYELFRQLLKNSNLRLIDMKGKDEMKLICDAAFITKAQELARMDFRYRKNRTIGSSIVNSSAETQVRLDKWNDG